MTVAGTASTPDAGTIAVTAPRGSIGNSASSSGPLFAFTRDASEWRGSVTAPDGTTRSLAQGDFAVDVLDWWTSPRSGIRYPHGWRLTVLGRALTVTPLLADQEILGSPALLGRRVRDRGRRHRPRLRRARGIPARGWR